MHSLHAGCQITNTGIYKQAMRVNVGTATVVNTTFTDNFVAVGDGYALLDVRRSAALWLQDADITGNQARVDLWAYDDETSAIVSDAPLTFVDLNDPERNELGEAQATLPDDFDFLDGSEQWLLEVMQVPCAAFCSESVHVDTFSLRATCSPTVC